jgi:hypothetical protein
MVELEDKIIKALVLFVVVIYGVIAVATGALLYHWIKNGGLQIFIRLWNLDFEVKVGLFILALIAFIASVNFKNKFGSWRMNKEYEKILGGK